MHRPLLSFAILLLAPAAAADTIVVSPAGPLTIQDAIGQANPGDVVELLDGVYRGDGNRDLDTLGKAITVRSQSGDPLQCWIDCEGSASAPHRGFLIQSGEGPQTVIEGLTITGGLINRGGGIACEHTGPTIRNCRFVANQVMTDGGGLYASGSVVVSDCFFGSNVANYGGGGAAIESTVAGPPGRMERCIFVDNYALLRGGGFRT